MSVPAIRHDDLLLRLLRDVNDIRSSLRRTVANLPLYDVANENTPATLSVDQNDYVPGNYDILRLESTQVVSITGIRNGVKGRRLQIFNVGAFSISLTHSSLSSSAENRFDFANDTDFIIPPSGNAFLYYDFTAQRWRGGDMASFYYIYNTSTPAALSNTNNDYDIGLAEVLRLTTTANSVDTITGMNGGVAGRVIEIINLGANVIAFTHEDTGSTAVNRFAIPDQQTIYLVENATIRFYYDGVSSRWRPLGVSQYQAAGAGQLFSSTINANVPDSTDTLLTPEISIGVSTYDYWDNTNKRFVADSNGLYGLNVDIAWEAAADNWNRRRIKVVKNGLYSIGTHDTVDDPGTITYMNNTFIVQLDAGDYVEVYGYQESGGALDVYANNVANNVPVFWFFKIGSR